MRLTKVILREPVTLLGTVVEEALSSIIEGGSPAVALEIDNPSPAMWSAEYRFGVAHCEGPGSSVCSFDTPVATGQARLDEEITVLFVPGLQGGPGIDPAGFSLVLPLMDSCERAFTLPLRQIGFDASLPEDYGCIGTIEEGPDGLRWNTTASGLVAVIPADEAKDVWIDEARLTLCDLLAAGDCSVEPETAWPYPPTGVTLDGEPAWFFSLNLAAIGVSIED